MSLLQKIEEKRNRQIKKDNYRRCKRKIKSSKK